MDYLTGSDIMAYFRAKGMYQLWTLFWTIFAQDLSIVFDGISATHVDLMEAIHSFVCVLIGIHGWALTPTIHV